MCGMPGPVLILLRSVSDVTAVLQALVVSIPFRSICVALAIAVL